MVPREGKVNHSLLLLQVRERLLQIFQSPGKENIVLKRAHIRHKSLSVDEFNVQCNYGV